MAGLIAPVPRPVPNAIAAALQNPSAGAAASPFLWSADGQPISADELARQRKAADALRPTEAPKGIWSLLGDLADEGVASYKDSKASDAEKAARKSVSDALANGDYKGALSSDMATPGQAAIASALWGDERKKSDPEYQLDLQLKRAQIAKAQSDASGGGDTSLFKGTGLDAQAWNVLQTSDPASREYATAYAIISQPKTQLVQTADGMMPVEVPPQLPSWLVKPGSGGAPPADGATPPAMGASPTATQPATGAPPVDPNAPTDLGDINSMMPKPPAASGGAPASVPSVAAAPDASAIIPGTKKPATEMQARNGAIGKILLNEVPTLGQTFNALADPKGQLLAALPAGLGNAWQSDDYQRAAAAVKTSVANVLYSLSGASSNPGEVINQIGVLTPQFGDKPPAIADKLNRFKAYVRSIASESNDADLQAEVDAALSKMPDFASGGQGGDNDPLGIR